MMPLNGAAVAQATPLRRKIKQVKQMDKLQPELSPPGAKAVGPSSPVQQALALVRNFLSFEPTPDIATPDSKSSGLLAPNGRNG